MKFGIYKTTYDPVLPDKVELVQEFKGKVAADAALKAYKEKETDGVTYVVREMK